MATLESPDPEEARRSLAGVRADEDSVRYPPLPAWFFAAMALIVAALFCAQLLGSADASSATLALAIVAVVLGTRMWLRRQDVGWVTPRLGDMASFLALLLGTFVACWAVSALADTRWVWPVGAVVGAVVVLRTGTAYRREFGDAR